VDARVGRSHSSLQSKYWYSKNFGVPTFRSFFDDNFLIFFLIRLLFCAFWFFAVYFALFFCYTHVFYLDSFFLYELYIDYFFPAERVFPSLLLSLLFLKIIFWCCLFWILVLFCFPYVDLFLFFLLLSLWIYFYSYLFSGKFFICNRFSVKTKDTPILSVPCAAFLRPAGDLKSPDPATLRIDFFLFLCFFFPISYLNLS